MKVVQTIALLLLIAIVARPALADTDNSRPIIWDRGELPEGHVPANPFNLLVLMYSTSLIKDSEGEPHDHGNVIQLIQDGGNELQDPPNPDGSPGGDDSLARGNFNMITLLGTEHPFVLDGESGQFCSYKYFVPLIRDGVYYLRIWEGDDVGSAPYFQDSSEYRTSTGDQGGGLLRISPRTFQGPQEADWKFGSSMPRPSGDE